MRRHAGGRRCGARGRGSQAAHPGGAGAPPGVTTDPCQELADGGRLGRPSRWKARQAIRRTGADRRKARQELEPKARPGAEMRTPQVSPDRASLSGWSAGRRPSSANGARQDGRLVRRSVLHPLGFSGGDKGRPASPGPQRIRVLQRAPMNPDDGAFTSLCRLTIQSAQ